MNDLMIKRGNIWTPIRAEDLETLEPVRVNFECVGTQTAPGYNVYFHDNTLPKPKSWNWNFGDGNESNLQNPSHQYQDEGEYTITLEVSYDLGNVSLTKPNHIQVSNQYTTTTLEPSTFSIWNWT